MSQCEIVVPIALQHTNEGVCTSPWWVQDSEYSPALASYEPLINGEVAFKAVYEAINAAQKSVDIICWGFQPSMYFIRDGAHLSIGALLKEKAGKGVQVRVLAWEMPLNAAGMAGEANLPGRSPNLMHRAGQTATDKQHHYDEWWFDTFSTSGGKAARRVHDKVPVLVTRGFSEKERARIGDDVPGVALYREIAAHPAGEMPAEAGAGWCPGVVGADGRTGARSRRRAGVHNSQSGALPGIEREHET